MDTVNTANGASRSKQALGDIILSFVRPFRPDLIERRPLVARPGRRR
jgi:hypothetical protein